MSHPTKARNGTRAIVLDALLAALLLLASSGTALAASSSPAASSSAAGSPSSDALVYRIGIARTSWTA